MGKSTDIGWTEATWNPFQGCRKVSPGCKYCYMYRDKERYGHDPTAVVRSSAYTFESPLRWKEPRVIFTCSWSDFFIEEADPWRADAWDIIRRTPHHIYQILTKRPERILQSLPPDWGDGWPNVWIGISAEDQKHYDLRWPLLAEVPAAVRFVSAEPLLGMIDFAFKGAAAKPDWVIVGGESGNGRFPEQKGIKYGYRSCYLPCITETVRQCKHADVPCFVKQLGTDLAHGMDLKHRAGADPSEWPPYLRKQQMPAAHKTHFDRWKR